MRIGASALGHCTVSKEIGCLAMCNRARRWFQRACSVPRCSCAVAECIAFAPEVYLHSLCTQLTSLLRMQCTLWYSLLQQRGPLCVTRPSLSKTRNSVFRSVAPIPSAPDTGNRGWSQVYVGTTCGCPATDCQDPEVVGFRRQR